MTAKNTIEIGDGMSLPVEYITTTAAILAKKRVGKTYLAQKIAEGLLAAGQQVVVIDMTSAWWGLRSSADGKSPGYPITIFGGRHGDVPLEATAGEMLANAIVADRFSAVLDVRLLKKGQRIRFIADFLEALYDKNTTAMHLFMDEADAYIPQRSFSPEEARALGAADELVRRGGIGVTMITQRAAVLNKNVLSQVDTLAILRMNHPKDIDSVTDWMEHHTTDKKLIAEIAGSISSLSRGEAWWLDPEHKTFKKITVSPKSTYDSGRTPKVGEQVKAPKVLAKVDLDRLGASIQETVERQKANDPKALKQRVAELENQLAKKGTMPNRVVEHTIEKPVVSKAMVIALERSLDHGGKTTVQAATLADRAGTMMAKAAEMMAASALRFEAEVTKLRSALASATSATIANSPGNRSVRTGVTSDAKSAPRVPGGRPTLTRQDSAQPKSTPRSGQGESSSLPAGEAKILRALIQYAGGLERRQIGVLTTFKRSTRDAYIARLRERGLVEAQGDRVTATDAGVAAMPGAEPLPTGPALQDYWLQRLPSGEAIILAKLLEVNGEDFGRDDLSEATTFKRSTRDAYLSRLAAKELVVDVGRGFVKASPTLFEVVS